MSGSASFLMEKKSSLRGLGACRNADGEAKPANWAVWLFPGIRDPSTGRRPMGFHSLS
jgi:hypothetical protein